MERSPEEYTEGNAGEDEDFSCCGGNDERTRFHCSDCPVHPWSVNSSECSHYYLASQNAKLKKCEHCGTKLKEKK